MKRRLTSEYYLTAQQLKIIKDFLNGNLGSRVAGEKLGISHQQVINTCTSLFRQWLKDGTVKFKNY